MEVTQTRLTNVYDSVEAYNAATTGATVPYHVLVLAGFPAGISDRAAELLGRWPATGPGAACISWPRWIPGSRCQAISIWRR